MNLKKWLNRKMVVVSALVLLLGVLLVAGYLAQRDKAASTAQLALPQRTAEPASSETLTLDGDNSMGDFFKDFRAQRESARNDEIALLDSIIDRAGAPQDSVREADRRRIQLTTFTEQERCIEKLLIAKGFEDAAAFIQEGSVSVIVKKEVLTQAEADKVLEVAMKESGQESANIKIIPVP